MDQSEQQSHSTGDLYEMNAIEENQAYADLPRTLNFLSSTPLASPPDRKFTEAVVTCCKEFLELMGKSGKFGVSLTKVLFTCTGLNDSHKSDVIKKALDVHDIVEDPVPAAGFMQYHLTSCDWVDRHMHIDFTTIDRKDPKASNFKKALFIAISLANLNIKIRNLNVQQDEPVSKLDVSVNELLCQLHDMSTKVNISSLKFFASFGLLNVWDIGLNRTVRPFLESFSGCFTNNLPFFFISVKEAQTLHAPPRPGSHSEGYFNWRSKLQYLLRPYQLALGSDKIICTVYITHDDNDTADNKEKAYKNVNEFCKFTFQQMQIEKKVKCNVYSIAHNDDRGHDHLLGEFKSLAAMHGKTEETKVSYLFLRCILAEHVEKSCIKREELKSLADSIGQKMNDKEIEIFCREFTSFGSILDVKQVNASSDLVIIKPNVFLNELEQFLMLPDVQESNILSMQDREMMIQVLVDVNLALYTNVHPAVAAQDLQQEVWLSSAFKFHNHKQNFTKGAIQFVLGLGAPRLNLNIRVLKEMMNAFPGFKLVDFMASNTIVFRIPVPQQDSADDYVDVTLSFMGNVIEISLASSENIPSDSRHIKSICSKLILIFKESVESCHQRFKENASIKYHFAVLCLEDEIGEQILFNAYRIRHILPAGEVCSKCWNDIGFKNHHQLINIWKNLLEDNEREIPSHLKLNGDFSMETIAMLAKRLATFPWRAIKVLATELQVQSDILQNEPANVNRKELVILAMLVRWAENENRRNQLDSLRAIMARKLHDAEGRCQDKLLENIPDFKQLAKELDVQVLTRTQRDEVVAAIQSHFQLDLQ